MRKSFLLFFSFLLFSSIVTAQIIDVRLIAGQHGTHLYQLDTTGLGGDVAVIQDLNSIGSVEFISVLDDYKMNYVTREGISVYCCVNIELQGATASRQYRFTFDVRENVIPKQEV